MPKLCLSMIVKNETHIIKECFDTIYDQIDYWVIVDTGSTDGTQEFIKNYFAEKGIPGELHERPWVGFGHNRTEALKLADGKADYIFMIDADDYLEGKLPLDKIGGHEGYAVLMGRMDFSWWRTQIFKSGLGWKYFGVLHEYPALEDQRQPVLERLMGNYRVVARTMGARNKDINPIDKYKKDAETLEKALIDEPGNVRYQFYLAQSYFDSHQWEKSEAAYIKRAEMGGWPEEVYYSIYRIGICRALQNKPWIEIQQAFLDAYNTRPQRAEPLYQVARIYRLNGKPALAYVFAKMAAEIPYPKDDILFIDNDVYRYGILDEIGSTAFYAGKVEVGYNACKALLDRKLLPESEVERVTKNLHEYEKVMTQMKISMNENRVEQKMFQKEQKKQKAFKRKERISR
jgi:glycosyltransferase involved in cell wall biosynthesis